jgi:hypothetical protein
LAIAAILANHHNTPTPAIDLFVENKDQTADLISLTDYNSSQIKERRWSSLVVKEPYYHNLTLSFCDCGTLQ